MSFTSGRTYPLIDPERYDDDYGEGYAYVRAVEGSDGCRLTDCWIVNERGEVHPGYDQCAVPILYSDVIDDPMQTLRSYAA